MYMSSFYNLAEISASKVKNIFSSHDLWVRLKEVLIMCLGGIGTLSFIVMHLHLNPSSKLLKALGPFD